MDIVLRPSYLVSRRTPGLFSSPPPVSSQRSPPFFLFHVLSSFPSFSSTSPTRLTVRGTDPVTEWDFEVLERHREEWRESPEDPNVKFPLTSHPGGWEGLVRNPSHTSRNGTPTSRTSTAWTRWPRGTSVFRGGSPVRCGSTEESPSSSWPRPCLPRQYWV